MGKKQKSVQEVEDLSRQNSRAESFAQEIGQIDNVMVRSQWCQKKCLIFTKYINGKKNPNSNMYIVESVGEDIKKQQQRPELEQEKKQISSRHRRHCSRKNIFRFDYKTRRSPIFALMLI